MSYKFDYICKCLVHNMNFLTEEADIDLCGDYIRWYTASHNQAVEGVTGRLNNKTGVTKIV